jgi:hypothetical protein
MVSIWNPKIVNESKEQTKAVQLHKKLSNVCMNDKINNKATFHVMEATGIRLSINQGA